MVIAVAVFHVAIDAAVADVVAGVDAAVIFAVVVEQRADLNWYFGILAGTQLDTILFRRAIRCKAFALGNYQLQYCFAR